jgi:energy-coupling factor transporter ATP-binding protein EcfA2
MFPYDLNRILVLAGHYGSGKTTVAAHLALELRKKHARVTLCDLDIVNPYFRTTDHREILEDAGVRLISSSLAGSSLESPGFPPEAVSVFDDESVAAVIDAGGDDRGALALGRYSEQLRKASILLVVNKYRPLSADARDAAAICREIESAGRFRFTGIINNSHLGAETTTEDVLSSLPYAEEVGKLLQLPVIAAFAAERLEITGEIFRPLNIFKKWVTL